MDHENMKLEADQEVATVQWQWVETVVHPEVGGTAHSP